MGKKHVRDDGTCENCGKPADLRPVVEQMRQDLKDAAGDLPVELPEPGTPMAKLLSANVLLRRENEKLRREPEWFEGLPTEPGDYWFYVQCADDPPRVLQGRSSMSGSGTLTHIASDFLYAEDFGKPPRGRVWHCRLKLPNPPIFDRTCSSCEGSGYQECCDCRGKGKI